MNLFFAIWVDNGTFLEIHAIYSVWNILNLLGNLGIKLENKFWHSNHCERRCSNIKKLTIQIRERVD